MNYTRFAKLIYNRIVFILQELVTLAGFLGVDAKAIVDLPYRLHTNKKTKNSLLTGMSLIDPFSICVCPIDHEREFFNLCVSLFSDRNSSIHFKDREPRSILNRVIINDFRALICVILWYVIAKPCEQIYQCTRYIGGHSLKHLAAARFIVAYREDFYKWLYIKNLNKVQEFRKLVHIYVYI